MPINIEVKAVIKNKAAILEVARKLVKDSKTNFVTELKQHDTFFNAEKCRLKLRRENNTACLIAYDRDDQSGSKRSDYEKVTVTEPDVLAKVLEKALGVLGEVKKERLFFLVEYKGMYSRIHIDDVHGLGDFIEFEVEVKTDAEVLLGEEFIEFLRKEFAIKNEDLIAGAYMDELAKDKSVANGN